MLRFKRGASLALAAQGLTLLALATLGMVCPRTVSADEPVAKVPAVARPAKGLAGALAHVRDETLRGDKSELLNQIDTVRDVVYTTNVNPKPVDEQFQFVEGVLRTPETGDARLYLPPDAPKYYELSITYRSREPQEGRGIGLGLVLDGRQFFLEVPPAPVRPAGKRGPASRPDSEVVRVLVGDCGFLVVHFAKRIQWAGPSRLLSLEPAWAVPAKDKLFLAFPDGQVDIATITLRPLERAAWLDQVSREGPDGTIARWIAEADKPIVSSKVDPLSKMWDLSPTFRRLALEDNFDELERWAERFRRDNVVVTTLFGSDAFYGLVASSFLGESQTRFMPDILWQGQLAFADEWIQRSPESVAARIVKARTYIDYAWSARGGGLADTVTEKGWELFHKRMALAEKVLLEAARQPTPDSCVYSALLTVGMASSWDHDKLNQTLEKGMNISPKNFKLYEHMVQALLPRWGGAPGEIDRMAETVLQRVKGDDGLEIYARIAAELREWDEEISGLSVDTLRASIPVMLKRNRESVFYKNFVCWLACTVDDPQTARTLFAEIGASPDMSIWKTRPEIDKWRHWSDPSSPEVSQFLKPEGEEAVRLQAYSAEQVLLQFLSDGQTLVTASTQLDSPVKFWDFGGQKLARKIDSKHPQWSTEDLRLLSDDDLFTVVWTGNRTAAVQKSPPGYAVGTFAKMGGIDIAQVSDDSLTGASVAEGQVTIVHRNDRERVAIRAPQVKRIALSRDGQHLLTLGEAFQLWDAATGDESAKIDATPNFFAFLDDLSGFVYVTDDKLAIWDLAKKKERFAAAVTKPNLVHTAAGSPRGRYLATGELRVDADGTRREVVALWDLAKPEPIHILDAQQQAMHRLCFSPDCCWLAGGSSDGVVKIWDVNRIVNAAAADKPATSTGGKLAAATDETRPKSAKKPASK
jgi:WD40 repeat protein